MPQSLVLQLQRDALGRVAGRFRASARRWGRALGGARALDAVWRPGTLQAVRHHLRTERATGRLQPAVLVHLAWRLAHDVGFRLSANHPVRAALLRELLRAPEHSTSLLEHLADHYAAEREPELWDAPLLLELLAHPARTVRTIRVALSHLAPQVSPEMTAAIGVARLPGAAWRWLLTDYVAAPDACATVWSSGERTGGAASRSAGRHVMGWGPMGRGRSTGILSPARVPVFRDPWVVVRGLQAMQAEADAGDPRPATRVEMVTHLLRQPDTPPAVVDLALDLGTTVLWRAVAAHPGLDAAHWPRLLTRAESAVVLVEHHAVPLDALQRAWRRHLHDDALDPWFSSRGAALHLGWMGMMMGRARVRRVQPGDASAAVLRQIDRLDPIRRSAALYAHRRALATGSVDPWLRLRPLLEAVPPPAPDASPDPGLWTVTVPTPAGPAPYLGLLLEAFLELGTRHPGALARVPRTSLPLAELLAHPERETRARALRLAGLLGRAAPVPGT